MRLALHWQILIALTVAVALGLGLSAPWGDIKAQKAEAKAAQVLLDNDAKRQAAVAEDPAAASEFAAPLSQAKIKQHQESIAAANEITVVGTVVTLLEFIGKLFVQALKMVVVPLVLASIICGVMNLSSSGASATRMGGRTLLYYLTTSTFAILIGLTMVNTFTPGLVDGAPAAETLGLDKPDPASLEKIEAKTEGKSSSDITDIFLRMLPTNVFAAASDNGQLLGVICFALLFGFFIARIPEEYQSGQRNFWLGAQDVMLQLTDLIMKFAPIGVFALVAGVVANSSDFLGMLGVLSRFVITVFAALATHVLIVLPAMLWFVGRISPIGFYRAMATPFLTAFSTASSAATLPVTMDAVQEAGVSKKTSSFVLPLGATINMDGTALYECVVVIFVMQALGYDVTIAQQIMIVTLALLTSIGVAGIPSASLVAITLILTTLGIDKALEAVAVIWVVDRILDMSRTAVNVLSDGCGAAIIAARSGEKILKKDA